MDGAQVMTGNLKPAPIGLTESVVAKLTGDRPAYGQGVVRVPFEGKLVDRPRGGEKVDG